jgi:hypothetical protein
MKNITKLAYTVIDISRRSSINDALEHVLGEHTEKNANTYQAVFDEVQNILHPHGTGEDSIHCDF